MKLLSTKHGSIAKHTSILVFGTLASQLMLVVASPIITRLYDPSEFGVLAIYSSILGAVGSVLSFRYDMAIVLPSNHRAARDLVNLSVIFTLFSSLAAFVFVYFLHDQIAKVFGQDESNIVQWLLVISIFLLGIHQIINFWATRNETYSAIAGSKVSQSFFMTSIQLTGYQFGSITLVVGQIIGQICSTIYLYYITCIKKGFNLSLSNRKRLIAAAKQYKKFPIYTTWSALANSAGIQLPIMLFALFFSINAAGYYALAQRILTLPMAIIGDAVQSVFFANIAGEIRENRAEVIVSHFFSFLARLALPPILLVIFFAPEAFGFVFGDKWGRSGELAQWMAIWILIHFCTGPLTLVFAALKHNKLDLILQGVLFVVRMMAIGVGVMSESFYLTIALFSVGSALCYMAIFIMICRLLHIKLIDIFRPLSGHLFYALTITVPLLFAKYYDFSLFMVLMACVGTVAMLIVWYGKLWNTYNAFQLGTEPAS